MLTKFSQGQRLARSDPAIGAKLESRFLESRWTKSGQAAYSPDFCQFGPTGSTKFVQLDTSQIRHTTRPA
jgi:hypothetical protein